MRPFSSGYTLSSRAVLVMGPVTTRVTGPSASRMVRAMNSTGLAARALCPTGPKSTPSSPLSPWVSAATSSSRHRGFSTPRTTGTPRMSR